MDEQSRRRLTFYFSSRLEDLSRLALLTFAQLIEEHVLECAEIAGYISGELASRPDNGHHPPG